MTGAIVYILGVTSGVNALIGGSTSPRVFALYAPASVSLPYIIVEQDGDDPSDNKSGVSALDQGLISVTIIATEYGDARDIANQVRIALDRYSGTVTSGDLSWEIQSIQYLDINEDIGPGIGDEGVVLIEHRYKIREVTT
jgi:hypothetical protein